MKLKAAHGKIRIVPSEAIWEVLVSQEKNRFPIVLSTVQALCNELLIAAVEFGFARLAPRSVSVLFCSDSRIHKLNQLYRGKDKPTDVLSFAMTEAGYSSSLGDLVISTETAVRQAKEYRVSRESEIVRLASHGLLHLLGYDHEKVSATEANRMRRAEKHLRAAGNRFLFNSGLGVFRRKTNA